MVTPEIMNISIEVLNPIKEKNEKYSIYTLHKKKK